MELSISKVAQVIVYAHELSRFRPELEAFLDCMNEDEADELVAIMWIGRGSFEPVEFRDAILIAQQERMTPISEYLLGTPHFGEHLEAGMERLGHPVLEEELLLIA
ncbi:MAG: DUF3775 domain-containing protein [Litoreibacter sp.]|nr:DUF3775 domain-containing protein [Litoreibacter sp.]